MRLRLWLRLLSLGLLVLAVPLRAQDSAPADGGAAAAPADEDTGGSAGDPGAAPSQVKGPGPEDEGDTYSAEELTNGGVPSADSDAAQAPKEAVSAPAAAAPRRVVGKELPTGAYDEQARPGEGQPLAPKASKRAAKSRKAAKPARTAKAERPAEKKASVVASKPRALPPPAVPLTPVSPANP